MGIMAVGTQKISSLTANKIARPFPVNACFPVSIDVSMTFTAKSVTLREIDEFPGKQPQFIPVFCIVAVETPSHKLGVMKLDVRMFVLKFPSLEIRFHGSMAVAARKHSLCNRRWSYGELLGRLGRRYKLNRQQEGESDHTNDFFHVCLY